MLFQIIIQKIKKHSILFGKNTIYKSHCKYYYDIMKTKLKGQMSESAPLIALLCISGGFMDAYTYNCRDKVFSNAQTGNMVLMGQNFATLNFSAGFRYLIPVLAFAAGIFCSELLRKKYQNYERLHWRQIVVLLEALLLFFVGFLPQSYNMPAVVLASFVCAMQVQAFRKLNGYTYATTMCIGNLRIATDLLSNYAVHRDKKLLKKSLIYYGFILIFIIGAALGGVITLRFHEKAIWCSSVILLITFVIMFAEGE